MAFMVIRKSYCEAASIARDFTEEESWKGLSLTPYVEQEA